MKGMDFIMRIKEISKTIVILIIILFVILSFAKGVKNVWIYNEIAEKQNKYMASTNVYAKYERERDIEFSDIKIYSNPDDKPKLPDLNYEETYKLNDTIKRIDCNSDINWNKYTTIYTPTQCIIYEENTKTMLVTDHEQGYDFEKHPIFYYTLPSKKYNIFTGAFIFGNANISVGVEDGKECFIEEYNLDDEYEYHRDIYDKETGFLLQMKYIYKKTGRYTYSFGEVTEENVAPLNEEEYTLLNLDEWKNQHYNFWRDYQLY